MNEAQMQGSFCNFSLAATHQFQIQLKNIAAFVKNPYIIHALVSKC
jgi:hypothetical protein